MLHCTRFLAFIMLQDERERDDTYTTRKNIHSSVKIARSLSNVEVRYLCFVDIKHGEIVTNITVVCILYQAIPCHNFARNEKNIGVYCVSRVISAFSRKITPDFVS